MNVREILKIFGTSCGVAELQLALLRLLVVENGNLYNFLLSPQKHSWYGVEH